MTTNENATQCAETCTCTPDCCASGQCTCDCCKDVCCGTE